MTGALAFLVFTAARNWLLAQLRRLRTPRYAIGFALAVGYFWMVFGRHVLARPGRPTGLPPLTATGSPLEAVAPALVLIVLVGIWLFGGDMTALAFSEAEVTMLMTAPVPRRALILYKLAQSQMVIMINVLIWTVLLRRGSAVLPGPLSALSVWVIFTTLHLHRMGEALTRASNVEYRAAGQHKKLVARGIVVPVVVLLVVLLVVMLVLEPLGALQSPDEKNPFAFLTSILEFFKAPGVQKVLYPFHLIVAPSFAPNARAWAFAMLPAAGIVLLHVWWVLRSDAAFEEAAAMASTQLAKRANAIRSRRSTIEPPATAGAKTFALAPTGWPIIAIVWKNAIALRRTLKPGALLRLPILVFGAAAFFGWKSGNPALAISMTALIMGILFPLIALQVLRSDLRTDMMHLPLLKSMPLAGADLVLAEVASTAIPVAVVRFVLLAIAGVALLFNPDRTHLPTGILAGILIALPVTILAIDTALCTIVNGSAVIFPSWIRLGPGGAGGVEMMGQAMLSMLAALLAFILMLLIPAGLGAGIWYVLSSTRTIATVLAGLFGAAVLGAESYFMMQALGAAFERAEPQQIA